MIQLVNERGEDEVAPVAKRIIERLTARHVRVADDATEEKRRLAGMSGSCPPGDVFTCVGGFATMVGGNATVGTPTCQQACDGGCCLGNGTGLVRFSGGPFSGLPVNSCAGFNGKVCKSGDIPSCSDNSTSGFAPGKACYYANITEVVNGCNGYGACSFAGFNGGDIRRVVNGCIGYDSCFGAAGEGGYIKEIVDSCIGIGACRSTANGGNIGYINHGCQGLEACQHAAFYRSIGGISYACNNDRACDGLAYGLNRFNAGSNFDSVNSAVVSCCNSDSECTGSIINASGLPDQCGTLSPTSSPTTAEVRMLLILYALRPIYQSLTHHIFLFIFYPFSPPGALSRRHLRYHLPIR